MRRIILALALLSAITCPAWADLKIAGDFKVSANRLVRLEAQGAADGSALIWDVSNEEAVDAEEVGQRFLFTAPAGSYKIKLRSIRLKDGKTLVETARATVTISEAPPIPPPPGPTPPPVPPSPAPIPDIGFRVLIIFDGSANRKMSKEQEQVLTSGTIQEYLDAKCVAGPKVKEWRIWEYGAGTAGESKLWQDAMARKPGGRDKLPWIIISDGKVGFEGPLPANITDTMTLLKKYGG